MHCAKQTADNNVSHMTTSGSSSYAAYSGPVIDSHCHLDFLFDRLGFQGNLERFCREYSQFMSPNFGGLIANFCDPKTSNDMDFRKWNARVQGSAEYPIKIWQSWSCLPTKANFFNRKVENFLKSIVNNPNVIAMGETGLDYSRLPSGGVSSVNEVLEQQRKALTIQCRIAAEARKPLVLHVRDVKGQKTTVHKDTIDIIKKVAPPDQLIHCHCFTGDQNEYGEWLKAFPNTCFGLTNMVGYNWARDSQALASTIQLNHLLLETDAPFMTPHNLPSKHGRICHPGMVLSVASTVASLRRDGACIDEIIRRATNNVSKAYRLAPLL